MAREFCIRNPEQLLKNMVTIRDILARHGIPCWLHNGTCLGAIRERNFIAHDDDADLGIYAKDYEKLIGLIPELEAAGLVRVPEYDWGGRLVQFVNKDEAGTGEQVDIFWEKPVQGLLGTSWDLGGRVRVPGKYLNTLDKIVFLGEEFLIPHDAPGLMRCLYGKTWRVPLKNVRTKKSLAFELKKLLANPGKLFFYIRRFIAQRKRIRAEARGRAAGPSGLRPAARLAIAFVAFACLVFIALNLRGMASSAG